jgi:hypothetical protein
MNLNRSHGKVLYGITSALAVLSALPVVLVFLAGFFYAGLAGDTPGDTGYLRYSIFASLGTVAAVFVFIGFVGSTSNKKVFSIFTMLGTSSLLIILVPFVLKAVRGSLQAWTFGIVFVEFLSLILSGLKLKQLSSMR